MSAHTTGRLNYAYDGKNVAAGGVRYCSLKAYTVLGEYTVIAKNVLSHDARRLAACWNACEGMATEVIEAMPAPFSRLFSDEFADFIGKAGQMQADLRAIEANYEAALALLAEVYEEGNLDIGDQVSKELDNRIHSFLKMKGRAA